MTVLAAIIFLLSLLTIAGMFLIKLAHPTQKNLIRIKIGSVYPTHEPLAPYFKKYFRTAINKLWHFILEAKDLKPATSKTLHTQVEKVKSVFRIRIRSSENDPQWLPEAAELSANPNQNPEDLYLQAIRRNPNDRSSYEALGRLYLQNKNYADAMETYQFLSRLDPSKDIYQSNLGLAYYSLREYKKAIDAYEKALNINNKIPTRWINLSLCYEALEDYPKAVKALVQALQLDKLNVNYMMMLADAYAKIPNRMRAEEVLEQVLSIEPTNKTAREKLMRLRI